MSVDILNKQIINILLIEDNPGDIRLIQELIKDVFDNLMINAVKHNHNDEIENQIKISEIKENFENLIKIEFIDNGKGIEDSRKEKIFLRGNKDDKYVREMGSFDKNMERGVIIGGMSAPYI